MLLVESFIALAQSSYPGVERARLAMVGAIQARFARSSPSSQTTDAVDAINRRYGLTAVIDRYRRLLLGLPNHENDLATAKQMSSGT